MYLANTELRLSQNGVPLDEILAALGSEKCPERYIRCEILCRLTIVAARPPPYARFFTASPQCKRARPKPNPLAELEQYLINVIELPRNHLTVAELRQDISAFQLLPILQGIQEVRLPGQQFRCSVLMRILQ